MPCFLLGPGDLLRAALINSGPLFEQMSRVKDLQNELEGEIATPQASDGIPQEKFYTIIRRKVEGSDPVAAGASTQQKAPSQLHCIGSLAPPLRVSSATGFLV